jgi:hypothetical protein
MGNETRTDSGPELKGDEWSWKFGLVEKAGQGLAFTRLEGGVG